MEDDTIDIVKEISDNCKVCITHKRAPSDPKVGLPVSREFNQCVTLDLKGPINNHKHYILYIIDSFSRLTRGVIIKIRNLTQLSGEFLTVGFLEKGLVLACQGSFILIMEANSTILWLSIWHINSGYLYKVLQQPILLSAMEFVKETMLLLT